MNGHRFIYQQADKINADSIAAFLVALRRQHPEKCKIHIIWDNAGYHHDKRIKVFAKSLAIELHYLPAYSPNLNPIERLWKFMRQRVMYNKYYEKFSEFNDSVLNFFKNIGRKRACKSFCVNAVLGESILEFDSESIHSGSPIM